MELNFWSFHQKTMIEIVKNNKDSTLEEEYGDESTCTLMPLAVEMGGAFLQTCEIHSQARSERKARRHSF